MTEPPLGFDQFCVDEWPRLVGALDLYCGDLPTAEELAEQALVRAARRWDGIGSRPSPRGWTYKSAIGLADSSLRRRRAEHRARSRPPATVDQPDHYDAAALMVRQAVAALPERHRTAMVLRYYVGLTADELGEVLDLSVEATQQVTTRAEAALRSALVAHPAIPTPPSPEGADGG